jgi:hypothetical protein
VPSARKTATPMNSKPDHIRAAIARYGSAVVSEGTLRNFDLVPAYLDTLEAIAPAAYQQLAMPACGFTPWPSEAMGDESHEWWTTEAADDLTSMLADALNEHAPDGYWFGASEGDGACFGFWPVSEES